MTLNYANLVVRIESGGSKGVQCFGVNPGVGRDRPVVQSESGGSKGVRCFGLNPVV